MVYENVAYYTHQLGPYLLHVGGQSDVGPKGGKNEDSIGAKKNIFVVADGVSNTSDSDIASRIAVEAMLCEGQKINGAGFGFSLERIVNRINNALFERQRKFLKHGEVQFATTLTAVRFYEEKGEVYAEYAHVGDSRLYSGEREIQGALQQMTQDHIVPEKENILSEAVGNREKVSVDWVMRHPVQKGAVFLLCTDGLSKAGTNAKRSQLMYELMKQSRNEEEIARALVEFANTQYGRDNASAIVVRVE